MKLGEALKRAGNKFVLSKRERVEHDLEEAKASLHLIMGYQWFWRDKPRSQIDAAKHLFRVIPLLESELQRMPSPK
jgi:hypothetical protein